MTTPKPPTTPPTIGPMGVEDPFPAESLFPDDDFGGPEDCPWLEMLVATSAEVA